MSVEAQAIISAEIPKTTRICRSTRSSGDWRFDDRVESSASPPFSTCVSLLVFEAQAQDVMQEPGLIVAC